MSIFLRNPPDFVATASGLCYNYNIEKSKTGVRIWLRKGEEDPGETDGHRQRSVFPR